MDLLSHLSVALLMAELLSLPTRSFLLLALGSVFPDIDGLGNFLGIPIHRSLLHDPLLWFSLLLVSYKSKRKNLFLFSLGSLIHCISDISFAPIPLYPLPLMLGLYAEVTFNGTKIFWKFSPKLSSPYPMYAGGYVVSQYGISLFFIWLLIAVLRRAKLFKHLNSQ